MDHVAIGPAEYAGRQQCFAAALAQANLDGAIVVSRGGATADRYASVAYLTGHYQHYSYLPDAPGLFSGRAHTVFVISAVGRSILCVSVPEYEAADIAAFDIRHGPDFIAGVADALASLGLEHARIGIVGADVLPANQWQALVAAVPAATFQSCDAVLDRLRRIKSPAEQLLIREAAAIHRRGVTALMRELVPGRTEADAVAALVSVVTAAGAGIYFTSVSSGPATWRWTSAPQPGFSRRVLQAGDLVRFDMGITWQGYLSDFGRAAVVGEASPAQLHLIGTLHSGLDAAIAAVRPGAEVAEIVGAGERALTESGVRPSDHGSDHIVSSFPVHWGHGLGLGWERPWLIETEHMTVEPGMYLAVERALTLPGTGTVAAEQNLLVGAHGAELLTEGPAGRWS